ncbi:hypothetical protein G5I_03500 [Acromyrmex echinatior]|uniref:Uncharacterized protein n=1 Tax=Acromyrmex echinatior TaxID=103372 RepID=F4WD50_ACREC|nr:hypothetical protein G5I_03500 [Acromyrmex echinatior]
MESKRGREREEKKDREREAVPAMADCRGSFNIATPVITLALTGDDSLALFRGFTGSSSAREGPREADTQQGKRTVRLSTLTLGRFGCAYCAPDCRSCCGFRA